MRMNKTIFTRFLLIPLICCLIFATSGSAWAWGSKKVDNRKTVAVFEVKSAVSEVDPTPYTGE